MRFPVKRKNIAETIRQRIQVGIYTPRERIPTEPELAREFGVARETLRGALGDLHTEGLIWRIPGEGTYISGTSSQKEDKRDLYLLIPCPDYFVQSDYQTRTTLSEILNGCLAESNRMNAHIVAYPITFSNQIEDIDWGGLERLPDGSRILFCNNWCFPIYKLLERKKCRVINIHYLTYENQEPRPPKLWTYFRADTKNAVRDSVKMLHHLGCRKIAIAAAFLDDRYNPAKEGYLDGIRSYNPEQKPILRDIGGYQDPPMEFVPRLKELYGESPFDGLIFGVHDELSINYRHSLNWNIGLPENVKIMTVYPYEYNRNLVPHIPCYTFDFREMAAVAARFLFSNEFESTEYLFKHKFRYMEEL